MSTPPAGWHPDPHDPNQLRWWDGTQWTSATHPRQQPAPAPEPGPEPTKPPVTPEQKKATLRLGIGVAAALALVLGLIAVTSGDDKDTEQRADDRTSNATSTTQTTTAVAAPPRSPTAPRPTATATSSRTALPSAQSATEAGCEEPDPSIVAAIEASLTEGRTLDEVAAVSTLVNGIEYIYTAGNVYRADGSRSVSAVVWITPGFGVMGLSSSTREVSTLPFGRGIVDANAGDEWGSKVQDCVTALARGTR